MTNKRVRVKEMWMCLGRTLGAFRMKVVVPGFR